MRVKTVAASILSLYAICCASISAQKLAPLPIEDAIDIRRFGQFVTPMTFSPDGQWLVYVVTNNRKMIASPFSPTSYARTGLIWSAIGAEIIATNLKTGTTVDVTRGVGDNWFPVWSPNGRHLAFLSDRDESAQAKLWVWEPETGALRKVSDLVIRTVRPMQWMPDGQRIVLSVATSEGKTSSDLSHLHGIAEKQGQKTGEQDGRVRIFKSDSPAEGGVAKSDPWPLAGLPIDVVTVDIATGAAHTVLRGLDHVGWFSLAPDGTHIALSVPKRFEEPGSQQIRFDLEVVDAASGTRRVLASDIRMSYGGSTFSWSPDSSKIAYRATGQMETKGDCFIVNLNNGARLNLTMFPPGAPVMTQQPPLWDASSKFVYFVRGGAAWKAATDQVRSSAMEQVGPFAVQELAIESEGHVWSPPNRTIVVALVQDRVSKESAFCSFDVLSGHATLFLKSARCHNCLNALYHVVGGSSGLISFFSEDANHPPDLWVSGPDFRSPQRVTRLNPQFDRYVMGEAELVNWQSDDGEQLQGALLLPAGYRQGERYPLITWVYGGDSLSDHLDRFGLGQDGPFNLQLFATRGYAVLLPDAPQHGATPMADLAKAVLPGINEVIEMGMADPDRIGVMGHSYGGYSTMALLVQSTRFKAAVVSGGFADLIAGYGAMEENGGAFGISLMEQGQGRMGGTPWQFRDRYIENSPVFYLDKIQTPILIVQGTADTATLPFLADELFIDLRRLGKQVEYAKYVGEEHTPSTWSYADQVDVARRWIRWFDRYLRPAAELSSRQSGGTAEP